MNNFRPTTKLSALLLLVLTLHTIAHSLVLPKYDLVILQEQGACSASSIDNYNDNDSDNQTHEDDCKPPKHSFIDYSTFFSPKNFVLSYNPCESKTLIHEPLQVLPQVYLEIDVPPDNLA